MYAAGLLAAGILLACSASAMAATYDFEDGVDGQPVASDAIQGVEFFPTGGRNWIYGDWRTEGYNDVYRPTNPDNTAEWDPDNNFFTWLGVEQDTGKINFTEGASYFAMSYFSQDLLTLRAYNSMGQVVDEVTGDPNLSTGEMGLLQVESSDLASVIIGDNNRANYWIIDNIDTDAFTVECLIDADCDDGVFCNGAESCDTMYYVCEPSFEPACPENDGLFCNGEEACDEEKDKCVADPPCDEGQECNEDLDQCIDPVEPEPEEEEPADPEQVIQGGACCACE